LSKTVFQYNNSIDKNEVHLLTPIRTKNKGPYFPIMRPPYYAFPVCAGITYTMGGIKTNQFMQVISVTDEPIRGLFAVGACTGGLEGGANIGYVGGLIKSSVMGFKAADFIAQNTHKNNL
jgi:fumarate reductase flavoprotein subunit